MGGNFITDAVMRQMGAEPRGQYGPLILGRVIVQPTAGRTSRRLLPEIFAFVHSFVILF